MISNLSLGYFTFENTGGLSYADYFSYTCNPSQLQARRINQASAYGRSY
jgi:hypothetical protein